MQVKTYIKYISLKEGDMRLTQYSNIGKLYRRRVECLSNLIFNENTQQEAADIIRSLIDRIEITPSEKRGQPCVELVGGLAAILLELVVSEQQKTAIQEDSGVAKNLLVAGAGFEPATFRL